VGGGIRKGVGGDFGENVMHSCMKMEKMRLVETTPEIREKGDKGEGWKG
jgi:hypothetical protein